ncbi:MAG: DNA repair exonuclease [Dehalococcoidia bacterium]|nr:DNA repair exonuclease [Dehalococcoidia bacterium]
MNTPHHKPPCRILHTADLHIAFPEDKACRSLEAVVNLAIKSRADLMLIAGDLFDHNRIEEKVLEFVREQFRRLPIPITVLPGNHDCLVPGSVYSKTEFWEDCRNLHVFRSAETLDLPYLDVSIRGKPIDTHYGDVRPLEDMPPVKHDGAWNIVMAHGYFVGTESPLFPSYHITEEDIARTESDYVALGHVPVFRCVCDSPAAYYSGSPSLTGTSALVDLDERTGVRVTRVAI